MNNDLFKTKFNELLLDATANFDTARFKDSARGFEYISQLCFQNGFPLDSIYFAYRTAVSWEMTDETQELIKLFRSVGIFLLKSTAKLCETRLNDLSTKDDHLSILENYQIVLKHLNRKEERYTVISNLIKQYKQLSIEEDHDEDIHLEKAIKYSMELNNPSLSKTLIMDLAEYYVERHKMVLAEESQDYVLVAKKWLDKAKKLFLSVNNNDKIKFIDELGFNLI